jgi:hypothetical protein
MEKTTSLLLLYVLLTAMITYDLVKTLRTGKARGRGGTVTRKGRPGLFKRYVIADVVMLVLCAAIIVAWLFGYA